MSIALITWGRFFDKQGNKITVPAPNTDPDKPWPWDFLCSEVSEMGHHFDALQLPSASKCLGGSGAGCDGYGIFDLRDLGSKKQQGSIPTRYGTKKSLLQAIAMAHANGMDVWLDIGLHQLMGENGGPGVFRYLGADGKTQNGRGATTPGWFRGNTGNNDPVPPFCLEDEVPNVFFDFPFGREKSFQHCNPRRITIEDALDFGDWLFRSTGADAARFDDVKGTWAPFVAEFMNTGTMRNKAFYSEYFEGNPDTLNWWSTSGPMYSRSSVEDFTTHWAIQSACDGGNLWPLHRGGFFTWHPELSVPFVDNPDTDTSPGQQVMNSKLLGYAYLLTVPCRMALVYGKDYFGGDVWPGSYGLKKWIDNLCWISRKLAFGAYNVPYGDEKAIVIQRNGQGGSVGHSPGLLTAINFDTWSPKKVTVQTVFWPGTHLHDFTGRHHDIWCDGQGRATFTIPSNAFSHGQSYLCFSWAGMEGSAIEIHTRPTTQTIIGAPDLDVPPAGPTDTPVGSVFAAEDSQISLTLDLPKEFASEHVVVTLTAPSGLKETKEMVDGDHYKSVPTQESGEVVISVMTRGPELPFELQVTYTAPRGLQ